MGYRLYGLGVIFCDVVDKKILFAKKNLRLTVDACFSHGDIACRIGTLFAVLSVPERLLLWEVVYLVLEKFITESI